MRFRRRAVLRNQLRIGQPLPGSGRGDLTEPIAIIVLTLIEPKSLLIKIPVEMRRINTNIGPLEDALQETPEILDFVGMNVIVHKLNGVVDRLVRLVGGETRV